MWQYPMSVASGNSLSKLLKNESKKTNKADCESRLNITIFLKDSQVPDHTLRTIAPGSDLRVELEVLGSQGMHIPNIKATSGCSQKC